MASPAQAQALLGAVARIRPDLTAFFGCLYYAALNPIDSRRKGTGSSAGETKAYSPEFKEQAVKKVVDSSPPRTITEVARELNINDTTLGFWVKAYRRKLAGQQLPSDMPDGERVRELERRVRELELENVFLKKAAAYFAREQR